MEHPIPLPLCKTPRHIGISAYRYAIRVQSIGSAYRYARLPNASVLEEKWSYNDALIDMSELTAYHRYALDRYAKGPKYWHTGIPLVLIMLIHYPLIYRSAQRGLGVHHRSVS
jgi:hypothetical protein